MNGEAVISCLKSLYQHPSGTTAETHVSLKMVGRTGRDTNVVPPEYEPGTLPLHKPALIYEGVAKAYIDRVKHGHGSLSQQTINLSDRDLYVRVSS
jgi:hypothetical protein